MIFWANVDGHSTNSHDDQRKVVRSLNSFSGLNSSLMERSLSAVNVHFRRDPQIGSLKWKNYRIMRQIRIRRDHMANEWNFNSGILEQSNPRRALLFPVR